jgi:hypothetical protein
VCVIPVDLPFIAFLLMSSSHSYLEHPAALPQIPSGNYSGSVIWRVPAQLAVYGGRLSPTASFRKRLTILSLTKLTEVSNGHLSKHT